MKRIVLLLALLAPLAVLAADKALKIGEIKGSSETLWQFLQRLPGTFEAQIFYAVVVFGAIGMFANYFVKWLRKEITGSLIGYLFVNNPRGTLLSLVTTIGAGLAALQMGVFETPDGQFIGWFPTLWITLGSGWMFDAALNKGAAPK